MESSYPSLPSRRIRRFGLALLLLAVPACGLSDYESQMRNAQERKDRFDEEQAYLDAPIQIPKQKNKDGKEEPVANLFLRPPKGIEVKPQSQPRNGLNIWRYARSKAGSNFVYVDLALPEDAADFANTVASTYTTADQATHRRQFVTTPDEETPMLFDVWETKSGQLGYSINVLLQTKKPLAVIYHYNKARSEAIGNAIKLSLESLAVDQMAGAARIRYNQKSPWRLEAEPKSD